MSGIKQAVHNQPLNVTCPHCHKERVITIRLAKDDENLACDCGALYDTKELAEAAKDAAVLMKKTIRKAGYR